MFRHLVLSTVLAALSSSAAYGQVLVQQTKPLKGTAGKPLTDQVKIAIAGAGIDASTCRKHKVEFTPVGGNGAVQPATDDGHWNGTMCTVRTTWTLGAIPDQELDVKIQNKPATRIVIKATASPTKPSVAVQFVGTRKPGLAGATLDKPVRVMISSGGADCSKYLVEFQSSGDGEAKPSAIPGVQDALGCLAETRWKLPSYAWRGDEAVLTATVKIDGKSLASATTTAEIVDPKELDITVRSPWGYVERDLGRPVSAILKFPQVVNCAAVKLGFQADGEGVVSPAIVRSDNGPATTCEFSTRWKLGKSPGKQTIRASVPGHDVLTTTRETIARAAPRVVGGILWVPNGVAPDTSDSEDLENDAAKMANTESDETESPAKREFVALAGIDLPFASLFPRDWSGQNSVIHRIRLVAGTEFGANAFKAAYFGVNLSVASSRLATEENPISIVAGYRIQEGGDNRWWFGLVVGAFDLLKPVAAGLGI